MKIVVYDIAANKGGGGETVLNSYFDRATKEFQNEWWFFVSIEDCKKRESNNIHVIYVNTKTSSKLKSYIIRKLFELFKLKRIIEKIKPDEIISLENRAISGVKCKQTVYLHQSLQFSPIKFRFIKQEERAFAFRQKIIGWIIKKQLNKADKIIVQTNWMKEAVSQWANYPENRIEVQTPNIFLPKLDRNIKIEKNIFIYPANAYLNKNHRIILDACKILKKQGYKNYKIEFTFSTNSSYLSKKISQEIKEENLPIDCIGHLDKTLLFQKYQTMIMIFPSYIETFGLPLLEAKYMGGRIIASDLPFSHEILDSYNNVTFVKWNDAKEWANAILKYIEHR